MPCFKGIAVSIHANGTPLPEYGMQKQSRFSRINSYIPVPQPQLNTESKKHEPAKFAISITLLTPGLPIPYSTPRPSESNPYPTPHYVGNLPSSSGEKGSLNGVVSPYLPMTSSDNETIAAYIYFDGRAKEEVATLLRPGEETWVNSRWVQVPDAEGGGLAEREFLFREVGLERWLNGLDLQGHDNAEKIERRRQKFEKRRKRERAGLGGGGMQVDDKGDGPRDTLRYGANESSPIEAVFDDESSSSDDDEPPEAAGQIKVAMFRVIASGEIKKGEYSPQFDAHDDDEEYESGKQNGNGGGMDADVEHTTSFAKPKTLDPKTISTQTVTGIDGPEKPYATFTFFYRGDRQLQKLGVLPSSKGQQTTPTAAKRRSGQLDFSNLGPLKTTGTVGFSAFRDQEVESARRRKARKKSSGGIDGAMEDSEDDDDDRETLGRTDDSDDRAVKTKSGPDDDKFQKDLTEGVDRIRLKRQHSAEPESAGASSFARQSPGAAGTPPDTTSGTGRPTPGGSSSNALSKSLSDEGVVGSPLKKHRASLAGSREDGEPQRSAKFVQGLGDVLAKAEAAQKEREEVRKSSSKEEEEEEL